jgi:hypothetical protein
VSPTGICAVAVNAQRLSTQQPAISLIRNGNLTLVIQPHIDRQTRKALYPYGSIPRLFLFWLVTEAKRNKSRHIRLGNSLDNFMREIGLNPRPETSIWSFRNCENCKSLILRGAERAAPAL